VTVTNVGQSASNLKTFLVATPPPQGCIKLGSGRASAGICVHGHFRIRASGLSDKTDTSPTVEVIFLHPIARGRLPLGRPSAHSCLKALERRRKIPRTEARWADAPGARLRGELRPACDGCDSRCPSAVVRGPAIACGLTGAPSKRLPAKSDGVWPWPRCGGRCGQFAVPPPNPVA